MHLLLLTFKQIVTVKQHLLYFFLIFFSFFGFSSQKIADALFFNVLYIFIYFFYCFFFILSKFVSTLNLISSKYSLKHIHNDNKFVYCNSNNTIS